MCQCGGGGEGGVEGAVVGVRPSYSPTTEGRASVKAEMCKSEARRLPAAATLNSGHVVSPHNQNDDQLVGVRPPREVSPVKLLISSCYHGHM